MTKRTLLILATSLTLAACSDEPEDNNDQNTKTYTLNFNAQFGDEAFDCNKSYANLGRGDNSYTPTDARVYIHDVKLIDASGNSVDLKLKSDGAFQNNTVALLDFEDGTNNCANGTAQTNTTITGQAPEGDYTQVSFKLGVPESLNHQNQATATSPLNITGLWWSWQNGYKHIKVDGTSDALTGGVLFHLGSTMCEGTEPDITCQNNNRPTVTLADWSTDKTIVFDLGKLFEQAHLDADDGGPKGCMSGPTDPDCAPLFKSLGLPFGQNSAETQTVFRLK